MSVAVIISSVFFLSPDVFVDSIAYGTSYSCAPANWAGHQTEPCIICGYHSSQCSYYCSGCYSRDDFLFYEIFYRMTVIIVCTMFSRCWRWMRCRGWRCRGWRWMRCMVVCIMVSMCIILHFCLCVKYFDVFFEFFYEPRHSICPDGSFICSINLEWYIVCFPSDVIISLYFDSFAVVSSVIMSWNNKISFFSSTHRLHQCGECSDIECTYRCLMFLIFDFDFSCDAFIESRITRYALVCHRNIWRICCIISVEIHECDIDFAIRSWENFHRISCWCATDIF